MKKSKTLYLNRVLDELVTSGNLVQTEQVSLNGMDVQGIW